MIARTINLRDKDRHAILQIARQTLPEQAELWAYGSRVKGTSHDASDLDLVIKMPTGVKLPAQQLVDFREALRDSNVPIMVGMYLTGSVCRKAGAKKLPDIRSGWPNSYRNF